VFLSPLFLLTALASPLPSPSPVASTDPCGGAHNELLATLNRPTIGFSPCSVKPHDVVIEGGYANQAGGEPLVIYPQGFIRFGTGDGLEVSLIAPSGNFDSGFGAKYEFWHNQRAALAIDALYTLPTGAAGLTSGAPAEIVNVDYATTISSRFGAGATIGVLSIAAKGLDGDTQRVTSLLPSLVVTNLWSERAQFYAEAYGSTRLRPDGGTLLGLDGGLQYLVSPEFEVDAEFGRVLTDLSASHYVGFGFGARF
jgi:Putative MetA-pathway of phenol degradation